MIFNIDENANKWTCYLLMSRFTGSAGQSFACFLTPGMNIRLVGEANDYVGKVMQFLHMCMHIFSSIGQD